MSDDRLECLDRAAHRISAGRRRNQKRDKIDRQHSHAAPEDCPIDVQLRTVQQALIAGLGQDDWSCIEEATAMLEDAIGYGAYGFTKNRHRIPGP